MTQPQPRIAARHPLLYVERCAIRRDDSGIVAHHEDGDELLPVGRVIALLIGPGVTVSREAISHITASGCAVAFTQRHGHRLLAVANPGDRSSANLLQQARLWASPRSRMAVARRMFRLRFGDDVPPNANMRRLRGLEGGRVKAAYREHARRTGVTWKGRVYGPEAEPDTVNLVLSTLNAALYAVTHAVVLGLGLSPAIGFIHTGNHLSFVHDVADLYKTDITIPAAFDLAAEEPESPRRLARERAGELFDGLPGRMVKDVLEILELHGVGAIPTGLWDPAEGVVPAGTNYGQDDPRDEPER
ncbi:MAG TPA: type I-E CRISPR-associated endonuclease Cas1 [Actinobacteria bacterium]|nr:type I-E CRISPR-associated endonuclease Cas1 [Actinomycetota bacterium]